MGFDVSKYFGSQLERAVVALETIAKGVSQMGEAAKVQQEMIQRALDASEPSDSPATPPVSLVGRKRKPRGGDET